MDVHPQVMAFQQMLAVQHNSRIFAVYEEGVGALFWREQDPKDAQHVIFQLNIFQNA